MLQDNFCSLDVNVCLLSDWNLNITTFLVVNFLTTLEIKILHKLEIPIHQSALTNYSC